MTLADVRDALRELLRAVRAWRAVGPRRWPPEDAALAAAWDRVEQSLRALTRLSREK